MRKPKPGYWWALFNLRCPRCRKGEIFKYPNPYKKSSLKKMLEMHECCPVCGQVFDLEPGFWFSTSYVSYGVTILISVVTFLLWWLFIGMSLNDNRIYYWLVFNAVVIFGLQPYLMRLSRWLVLNFFVPYNENWETEDPVELR